MINELKKKSQSSLQRRTLLKAFIVAIFICMTYSVLSAANKQHLHSYSYISPSAKEILQKFGISEAEIKDFTDKGIKSRDISPIDSNRLYEGSEDGLLIDIRKKSSKLLIELSVRQGVSFTTCLNAGAKAE